MRRVVSQLICVFKAHVVSVKKIFSAVFYVHILFVTLQGLFTEFVD